MLLIPFRRSSRSRIYKLGLIIIALWAFLETIGSYWSFLIYHNSTSIHPPQTYPHSKSKIFIASTHWNNELILRSHWNDAVLALVHHFGVNNIYVSIYESGSRDDSKGALTLLDRELGRLNVQRTIILNETTHLDEIQEQPPSAAAAAAASSDSDWIDTPRGTRELRRIPYLSKLRNRSLEPLRALKDSGLIFDKILFLNDVVFQVSSP